MTFWVLVLECMCAQTRPWFILSPKRVCRRGGGGGVGGGKVESEPILVPREKSPLLEKFSSEEDQTHNTASSRTASPTHYQLSYSSPGVEQLPLTMPTLVLFGSQPSGGFRERGWKHLLTFLNLSVSCIAILSWNWSEIYQWSLFLLN